MRNEQENQETKRVPSSAKFGRSLFVIWMVLLASMPGAFAQVPQGGLKSPQGERKKQEEEARKPPLEIGLLKQRFAQEMADPTADEGPMLALKPGHWTATAQHMQSNFNDFVGIFSAELLDDSKQPAALEHSRFSLRVTRDVTLAKGKEREIEAEVFLPQRVEVKRLQARIASRDSGEEVFLHEPKIETIPAYQYSIVVLAKEPDQYAFLKVTDTARAPWEEEFEESSQVHYQVALAKAGATIPLPENSLAWTTVAYILWDEVDPTRFSVGQEEALLDWIHWGGRLVVSGPDSLALLRGSFLEPFLPAEDNGPREIKAGELAEWSRYWGQRESGSEIPLLEPKQPFSGIQLEPREGAAELVGGGGLFYSRTVGRGAITVSALRLPEREFINWPGFDGFLNGGLFGRPRRVFSAGAFGGTQVDWSDLQLRRLDAHLTTPLRLFTRDFQVAANTNRITVKSTDPFAALQETSQLSVDRPGGLGAWDDFSPAAQVARDILVVAAGVQVPGAAFVIGCLAFYLLVLVPVNWLIFHTIERIEWAWIAVPFLAVFGTWVVVKQAQLDIGFVRAQTEVAVLELHNAHDRGLLSRFAAMYSSLAATYEIEFPDQSVSAVLPFPANSSDPADWQETVVFHESSSPRLDELTVSSSATRLIHAEQVVGLAGPVQLGVSSRGHDQVENRTEFDLRDAVLVRRTFDRQGKPRYEGSWLGDIRSRNSAVIGVRTIPWDAKRLPFAREREVASRSRPQNPVDVASLVQLALQFNDQHDPAASRRDETRLVAVIDEALPGMEVAPEASQRKGATVVIAHLDFGPLPTPQPDVNTPADVVTPQRAGESL